MAPALIIAGAGMAAAGSIYGGVMAYKSGKAQEKNLKNQARAARLEGENKARMIQGNARRFASVQRARFAGSGVELSNTASDVQFDSAVQFRNDATNEIYKGNQQWANLRTQGNFAYTEGRNALVSGIMGGTGQMMSGTGMAMSPTMKG